MLYKYSHKYFKVKEQKQPIMHCIAILEVNDMVHFTSWKT